MLNYLILETFIMVGPFITRNKKNVITAQTSASIQYQVIWIGDSEVTLSGRYEEFISDLSRFRELEVGLEH